ncbi:tRNA-5-methyluridine(54) 2-sulfurtransferase, partial [Clarias magur]
MLRRQEVTEVIIASAICAYPARARLCAFSRAWRRRKRRARARPLLTGHTSLQQAKHPRSPSIHPSIHPSPGPRRTVAMRQDGSMQ